MFSAFFVGMFQRVWRFVDANFEVASRFFFERSKRFGAGVTNRFRERSRIPFKGGWVPMIFWPSIGQMCDRGYTKGMKNPEAYLGASDLELPLLLMEEVLHHLACIKPSKQWDIYHINWRISSINSKFLSKHILSDETNRLWGCFDAELATLWSDLVTWSRWRVLLQVILKYIQYTKWPVWSSTALNHDFARHIWRGDCLPLVRKFLDTEILASVVPEESRSWLNSQQKKIQITSHDASQMINLFLIL